MVIDQCANERYLQYNKPFMFLLDKPVCKITATAFVGTTINEKVQIPCDVDAHPRPKSYQWVLNNSLGFIELEVVS